MPTPASALPPPTAAPAAAAALLPPPLPPAPAYPPAGVPMAHAMPTGMHFSAAAVEDSRKRKLVYVPARPAPPRALSALLTRTLCLTTTGTACCRNNRLVGPGVVLLTALAAAAAPTRILNLRWSSGPGLPLRERWPPEAIQFSAEQFIPLGLGFGGCGLRIARLSVRRV